MANMDIFQQDAFGLMQVTAAVNQQQFVPSRLRDMGLFRSRGITTTTVGIEQRGNTLALVQTSPRGAPPEQRVRDRRKMRPLNVPHLSKEAVIYADQVQGVRAFGTESDAEMVGQIVDQETGLVRTEIDMTEENLMLGAVRGQILDADGSVIYNLFDEFDVSEPAPVNFALGTATTKVRNKCAEVKRRMAKEMQAGGMPFRVHAFCGDNFFDKLVSHQDVEKAYERYQDGAMLREDLVYEAFPFAGVTFENYRSSDDETVGIGADECRFFAVGIPGLFDMVYAPADTMDTVNTIGLPRYAIPGMDPSGKQKYMSYEVQANPLPYCTRPQTLLKGTVAA